MVAMVSLGWFRRVSARWPPVSFGTVVPFVPQEQETGHESPIPLPGRPDYWPSGGRAVSNLAHPRMAAKASIGTAFCSG